MRFFCLPLLILAAHREGLKKRHVRRGVGLIQERGSESLTETRKRRDAFPSRTQGV